MIVFIAGLMIGTPFGFIICALLSANKFDEYKDNINNSLKEIV